MIDKSRTMGWIYLDILAKGCKITYAPGKIVTIWPDDDYSYRHIYEYDGGEWFFVRTDYESADELD